MLFLCLRFSLRQLHRYLHLFCLLLAPIYKELGAVSTPLRRRNELPGPDESPLYSMDFTLAERSLVSPSLAFVSRYKPLPSLINNLASLFSVIPVWPNGI